MSTTTPEQFLKAHSCSVHLLDEMVTPFVSEDIRTVRAIPMAVTLAIGPSAFSDAEHRRRRVDYALNSGRNTARQRKALLQYSSRWVIGISDFQQAVQRFSTAFDGFVVWGAIQAPMNVVWAIYALSELSFLPLRNTIAWLAYSDSSNIRSAFVAEQPITQPIAKACSSIWKEFTCGTPWTFEEACLGSEGQLRHSAEMLASVQNFFPRRVRGRLRLSYFDEYALGALSDENWTRLCHVTPAIHDGPGGVEWYLQHRWQRLMQWLEFGSGQPVVEYQTQNRSNRFSHDEFRLTVYGKQLQQQGPSAITDIPSLEIGGFDTSRGEALVASGSSDAQSSRLIFEKI